MDARLAPIEVAACVSPNMNARQTAQIPTTLLRTESAHFPRLGTVLVRWSQDDLLVELLLPDLDLRNNLVPSTVPMRRLMLDAISAYLDGASDPFSPIDLLPARTPFSARVREAMLAIPRGATRSYGQLAQAIGSPKAFRAIGQCCGSNPVPLIVPCHRVVAAKGLGGFALGLRAKQVLLDIETISPIAS